MFFMSFPKENKKKNGINKTHPPIAVGSRRRNAFPASSGVFFMRSKPGGHPSDCAVFHFMVCPTAAEGRCFIRLILAFFLFLSCLLQYFVAVGLDGLVELRRLLGTFCFAFLVASTRTGGLGVGFGTIERFENHRTVLRTIEQF